MQRLRVSRSYTDRVWFHARITGAEPQQNLVALENSPDHLVRSSIGTRRLSSSRQFCTTTTCRIDALDAAGIPYMIVASLASNVHGIPRSTRDADLVVEADPSGWDRLGRALVAVRGDSVDWRYIRQWCTVHRTLDQLEAIRSTILPA